MQKNTIFQPDGAMIRSVHRRPQLTVTTTTKVNIAETGNPFDISVTALSFLALVLARFGLDYF
jgi:hypothetical protein